jgi:hypothetical protein
VGEFGGGGKGWGGDVVAGYKGGGEEGREEGNRKFCATFRMPAAAFSFVESCFFTINLPGSAVAAEGHSISHTINKAMIIKFFFIFPSFFIIRLQGY